MSKGLLFPGHSVYPDGWKYRQISLSFLTQSAGTRFQGESLQRRRCRAVIINKVANMSLSIMSQIKVFSTKTMHQFHDKPLMCIKWTNNDMHNKPAAVWEKPAIIMLNHSQGRLQGEVDATCVQIGLRGKRITPWRGEEFPQIYGSYVKSETLDSYRFETKMRQNAPNPI